MKDVAEASGFGWLVGGVGCEWFSVWCDKDVKHIEVRNRYVNTQLYKD